MDFADLVINIQIKAEEVDKSLGAAVETVQKFAKDVETAMKGAFPPDALAGASKALKGIAGEFPAITTGITSAAGAFTGLISVAGGIKDAIAAFKALSSAALGPLGLIAAAVGVAAAGYTALKQAAENAAKAEAERKQAIRDAVVTEQTRLNNLRELRARYEELSSKSARTMDENAEMAAIIKELASAYGIEAIAVNSAAEAHERFNAAIADADVEMLKELYSALNKATSESILAVFSANTIILHRAIWKIVSNLETVITYWYQG